MLNQNTPIQAQEELWLECAQKLTAVIQQIIEFAKMVPGFMKLSQDDQIVLLKTGTIITLILYYFRFLKHLCEFLKLQGALNWPSCE